jgi:hypothetical protein
VLKSLPYVAPKTAGARAAPSLRLPASVLQLLVAVVVAFAAGRAVASGREAIALAPAAAFSALLLSTQAWLPYAAILLACAGVAEPYAYPQLAFGAISPFVSEVLLGLAVAAAALALPRVRAYATREPRTITVALTAFLLAAVMGAAIGKSAGLPTISVFNDMREVAFVAAFWPALVALRSPRARAQVYWLAVGLALVVVALQFAQIAVGTSHILFYTKDYATNLITCPSGQCADVSTSSFIRVRPPGLQLVYIVGAFSACYCLFGPPRRRGVVLVVFGLCVASLAVSLNRSLLGGLALGLAIALLVSPRKSRLLGGAVAAVAIALTFIVVAPTGALGSAAPVVSRFATLAKPAELTAEGSLKNRSQENALALHAVLRHPLEGIGWGTPYGKTAAVVVDGRKVKTIDQPFVHNMYLGIWMRTGLVGLVAFVTALVAAFVYGARWCRMRLWDERTWVGAGVVASVVAVSASSAVDVGSDPEKIIPLMAVLALAVTLAGEMGSAVRSQERRSS